MPKVSGMRGEESVNFGSVPKFNLHRIFTYLHFFSSDKGRVSIFQYVDIVKLHYIRACNSVLEPEECDRHIIASYAAGNLSLNGSGVWFKSIKCLFFEKGSNCGEVRSILTRLAGIPFNSILSVDEGNGIPGDGEIYTIISAKDFTPITKAGKLIFLIEFGKLTVDSDHNCIVEAVPEHSCSPMNLAGANVGDKKKQKNCYGVRFHVDCLAMRVDLDDRFVLDRGSKIKRLGEGQV